MRLADTVLGRQCRLADAAGAVSSTQLSNDRVAEPTLGTVFSVLMKRRMAGGAHEHEIILPIIVPDPIQMVDNFSWSQQATELPFHDQTLLLDKSAGFRVPYPDVSFMDNPVGESAASTSVASTTQRPGALRRAHNGCCDFYTADHAFHSAQRIP